MPLNSILPERAIADIIGVGMQAGLRKFCDSPESVHAWQAINDMPDQEWNTVCLEVAHAILVYQRGRQKES